MKNLSYKVFLKPEPEGGYTVTVPSLPGCITYGEDISHAIEMAKDAVSLYIESLIAHHEPIPTESDVFEYTITLNNVEYTEPYT